MNEQDLWKRLNDAAEELQAESQVLFRETLQEEPWGMSKAALHLARIAGTQQAVKDAEKLHALAMAFYWYTMHEKYQKYKNSYLIDCEKWLNKVK